MVVLPQVQRLQRQVQLPAQLWRRLQQGMVQQVRQELLGAKLQQRVRAWPV